MNESEAQRMRDEHDAHMVEFFASIGSKQRAILIEGLGETLGMINAGMIEDAKYQLRTMMGYLAGRR